METNMKWARRAGLAAFALGYAALGAPSCANIAGLSDLELVDELPGTGGTGTGTGTGGSTGTKQLGDKCAQGGECVSGSCADAVCCDLACDGPCVACVELDSHQPDGTCGPIAAGEDPAGECGTATCGGSGTCSPALEWDRSYAGDGCDSGASVALRKDDEVVLALSHSGSIDFGDGSPTGGTTSPDVAVARVSATDGSTVLSKDFPMAGSQIVAAAVTDADGNVYVCGRYAGTFDAGPPTTSLSSVNGGHDIFVLALGPLLQPRWSASIGGPSDTHDRCQDLSVDAGGVTVVGAVGDGAIAGGSVLPTAGNSTQDALIARYDFDGNFQWAVTLVSDGDDRAYGVEWLEDLTAFAVVGRVGGEARIDNQGDPFPWAGDNDAFLLGIHQDGTVLIGSTFGGPGADSFDDVTRDADNDIIVCGSVEDGIEFEQGTPFETDGTDVVIAKFSSFGAFGWARTFGGTDKSGGWGDLCRGVATRDDTIVLSGLFETSIDFGGGTLQAQTDQDLFVAALNGAGEHLWSTSYTGSDVANHFRQLSMALHGSGELYLAGEAVGGIHFGGTATASNQGTIGCVDLTPAPEDAYLVKLLLPGGG